MRYELFIARRYLRPKRSQLFVSLTTMLTMLGVTLGVATLIIVLSGMNGFAGEILRHLIGMNAHLWVQSQAGKLPDSAHMMREIRGVPGVIGVSPTIYEETLLANPSVAQTGAQIKGVDTASIGDVSNIMRLFKDDSVNCTGRFFLGRDSASGDAGIVLGWQLAGKLQVFVGDRVFLVVPPKGGISPMMMMQPRLVPFRVTGVFDSGFFEFDATLAVVDLGEAQRIFDYGSSVTAIEVKLADAFMAEKVDTLVSARIGGYPFSTTTWVDLNGGLYKWLMIEKWFAFVVLSLIILVAAFNIVSTLTMVVRDKTKEIGILKAMGATSREISRIFLVQGFFVGVVGTFLGGILGYALCWVQDTYHVIRLPAELYQVNAFPVEMRIADFVAIGAAAILICLLSAVYPAWKAANMHPVEAIRHD
jgi:lipoprotein-releasing system permease protein